MFVQNLKNITFSAEERLIRVAREKAQTEHTTLNQLFRDWLARYVSQTRVAGEYEGLMERLSQYEPGRKFSRDELNE